MEDTYKGQVDNPLTLNRYTYVHNNPLRFVDSSGHQAIEHYGGGGGGGSIRFPSTTPRPVKVELNPKPRLIKLSPQKVKALRNKALQKYYETKQVSTKGTGKIPSDFADRAKLEGHFDKHGKEFGGLYKNADEYLEGAREVIKNGIKVKYEYKDEIRTGYVRFMGNNKDGKAKFEFVGTNNNGEITTYHTQSGKKFWKTINGENIPVINPAE